EALRDLAAGREDIEDELEDLLGAFRRTLGAIDRERAIVRLARSFGIEGSDELGTRLRLLEQELDAHLEALVDLAPHAEALGDQYRTIEERARSLTTQLRQLTQEMERQAREERLGDL